MTHTPREKNFSARFAAGALSLAFRLSEDGVLLTQITDLKAENRIFRGSEPLFQLSARNRTTGESVSVHSGEGWSAVQCSISQSVCSLTFSGHLRLPHVTVILTAVGEDSRVSWSVRLHSANRLWSLTECDYPILPFTASGTRDVFFPYGCGEVYPSLKTFRTVQNYPSYGVSMQYMAFWDRKAGRGLYVGLHDPAPAYKRFLYEKQTGNPVAHLKASMPLRDLGLPANSQTLEGELVWELFDGDWYDAALLYRAFVLDAASWIPERKNGFRTDTPEWLLKNPHWWRKRLSESDVFADELLRAADDLGLSCPSPVHLYDWHRIPYDTNYPHYFPPKDCFVTGIQKLRRAGMRVMPYINGRLWDTHDRGTEDWQFTSVARPFCTKNKDGDPFIEIYPTSRVELAVMCPSSALWQEKQAELVRTLFEEWHVNGVYIDQIGAAQPYPCEDGSHMHRPGGGTWWVESYRNLIDHVRRAMPEDGFLTTECTSEPYMKNIQGFLSWIWIKDGQVPAFMTVYNGYVILFGRNYAAAPTAVGQNLLAAQSLSFGEQMGWIYPDVYGKLKNKSFYRKCVRCREAVGSFFYSGTLMRSPAVLRSRMLRTRSITIEAYGGKLSHTAVFSELWKRSDGAKLLLLINASGREEHPLIRSCNLPDGLFNPSGDLVSPVEIRSGELSPVLPPFSVSYILFE